MNFTKLNIKDYRKSRTSSPIMTAEVKIPYYSSCQVQEKQAPQTSVPNYNDKTEN
jgi:hypothetical protein